MRRSSLISTLIGFAITGGIVVYLLLQLAPDTHGPTLTVYKSATCGCCQKWVDHLRENGFKVKAVNRDDLPEIKEQHGVTESLAACHTALVDSYVVEGHVPADVIRRLLRERPEVKGIAVPGMPLGSPGMENPNPQPYSILTSDDTGKTAVYEVR